MYNSDEEVRIFELQLKEMEWEKKIISRNKMENSVKV